MKIHRNMLLTKLKSLQPAISSREVIEQSTHFIFKDNYITTYNDEVMIRTETQLDIEGAIVAAPLIALLDKLNDDQVKVKVDKGQLRINGKKRKGGVKMDMEISDTLPIDTFTIPNDMKYNDLPDNFQDAVKACSATVGHDDSKFIYSCLHLTPTHIESSDSHQISRVSMEMDIDKNILIPAASVKALSNYRITGFAVDNNWMHFEGSDFVFSVRIYEDKYPPVDKVLKSKKFKPLNIPHNAIDAIGRAEVFAKSEALSNVINISFSKNKVEIKSENDTGWYEETIETEYDKDEFTFAINPVYFKSLLEKSCEFGISDNMVKAESDNMIYVSCLIVESE